MSFFGFDASGRHSRERNGDSHEKESPLDFEDTYKGLGEYEAEEEDFLNDETFGAGAELGTDFDFGHGNGNSGPSGAAASSSYASGGRSYVAVARSGVEHSTRQPLDASVDLRPMESLWSSGVTPAQAQEQSQTLSMEELERQQRHRQMGGQPGFMAMPPPGYGMPAPPQGFPQQPQAQAGPGPNVPFGNQFPSPYPPRGMQPGVQGMPPQFQNMPAMFNQAYNVPQGHAPNHQFPGMFPPPPSSQTEPPSEARDAQRLQSVDQNASAAQNASPGRQPVQRALSPQQQRLQTLQAQPSQQQQQQPSSPQPMISPPQTPREHGRSNRGQTRREPMTPEEQKRLQIRQAKVEKILKHSGLMTPRDKDFITRYQLSQIVTEDPYNEDFYFQVYKIIQRGGVVGESNKDLIARAYLEHSGHRLGGRYKRADVALQRMQSQVEKAVTVAKERPQKNKDHSDAAREGVLGRISSSMNSKAPRRQLQIPVHKTGDDSADDSKLSRGGNQALNVVTESLDQVEISQQSRARRRSSYAFTSVDQNSVLSRSGGRKFVLSLIETVYEEVLELEAQLRGGNAVDSTTLWEALHIGDSSYEVCPFISMLSFDKGIKIMPRIFNFLDNAQKLKLLQTFFGELSHLNIIIISSYKTNTSPSESQLKQIELFQAVFLKIIVSFLSSSANFIEIMGLLLYLIKNNNVSFISTSKIGLNLITVLISRAALIRQDINRTNVLSSPEISAWNEVYDKLFTSLETKLFLVFPPKEYMEKIVQATSRPAHGAGSSQAVPKALTASYDQAYIWQFLASLALSGKLNHQRIIIDEIRDEIFGTISVAEELGKSQEDATASQYKKDKLYQDLNLFLNVMGLVARDGEITELK
ncbi:hypothetical protein HG536_0A09240 [Torulaspora globosa]|uniref:mRNA decay factor PAT1 domain-containing protein n=1 Tax=Torulaspora globosa TaxID=48254 RepID=A0A7G3ZC71_9SACH|nr:uncharacterized protein HG536_0A09240 [Torulaspora globosa]QLL31107.1 hypothetical protein HG536_0A09240 [Torulaspora globosa]